MSDRTKPIKVPKLAKRLASAVSDSTDDDGDAEAELLGSGKSPEELKKAARHNDFKRKQKFKDHFENITICGIYSAGLGLFVVGLALLLHMVLSKSYHWLSPEQIADLKNIVTGGVLAGVVASHLKRRL